MDSPTDNSPTDNSPPDIRAPYECRHEPRPFGRISVIACGSCGVIQFLGPAGAIDPAEGMAALFGDYDLIGPMPAIGAPAPVVLAYRPNRVKRGALGLLPPGCWLRVESELWVASGGGVLLLATPDRLMVHNLTRGA
ncbi:MAG: hypothetical protein ACLFWM_10460 [Actinomycetota bacterium]